MMLKNGLERGMDYGIFVYGRQHHCTLCSTLTPNPSHECSRTSPKQLTPVLSPTALLYYRICSVSALSRVYRLYDTPKKTFVEL